MERTAKNGRAPGPERSPSREIAPAPRAFAPGLQRASFVRARLGSVLAVVPLGVWTFVHIWRNLSAFQGPEAWQAAVTQYAHPVAEAITAIVVLLPLALHSIWGIGRLAASRPNNLAYRFYGNLKYLLQRLSAVGVLLFLGAHLWLAMLRPRLVTGHAEPFADLAHEMHYHWPTLATYVLGTLGVSYHLANGAQTFCMSWGIVSSRGALQRLDRFAIALFALLLAMAWGVLYALWLAGAEA
jgi:succinate dehydrogenase / fumarate reductase, cytochrome b subunit